MPFSSKSKSEVRDTTQVSNVALDQIAAPVSLATSGGRLTEGGGVSISLDGEKKAFNKANVSINTQVIDPGAFRLAEQVQRDQSILSALQLDFAGEAIRDSLNLAHSVSDQAGDLARESVSAVGDLSSQFQDQIRSFAAASTRDDSDRIQTVAGWGLAVAALWIGLRAWRGRAA